MGKMSQDMCAQQAGPIAPAAEDALYRKVIWRIVPLFFLGFMLSYLDRVNIGIAKLQMAADFGFSDKTYALGASIFFWAYMIFEIPSNMILRKVGARLWISRIMITWGLVSMAMVFSRNATAFYCLRFLLGVCEAGFVPGVMYYTNSWLPAKRQSGMYSLFLMALPFAIILGAPISGAILQFMTGVAGYAGWHWLFVLEGLPAVILGIVILVMLRNKPADVSWLSEPQKRFIEAGVTTEATHKVGGVGAMLLNPRVWLLCVTMIMFNTGFYGLTFWMPTLFKNSGINNDFTIGLLTAIPYAVAAIAMRLYALHAERRREHRLHGTFPGLLGGICLFAATYYGSHFIFALAMLSLTTACILSLMPIYWTVPGRLLTGPACAIGLAMINSCGSFSGILGSLVVGYAGMQLGMYIMAAFLIVYAVLFFCVCPKASIDAPAA